MSISKQCPECGNHHSMLEPCIDEPAEESSCEHGTPACWTCSLLHRSAPTSILYTIEQTHLDLLKTIAERLRFVEDDDNTSRDAAIGIMSVVRYAEALQALRGPGEPYVHLNPKEKP